MNKEMEVVSHQKNELLNVLQNMIIFATVAENQSFSLASKKIGVPVSTLSRRVQSLEEQMGLKLLNRSTRDIKLTSVGEFYYQQCGSIIESVKLANSKLKSMSSYPKGVLRVLMPIDLSHGYLTPLIAEFAYKYPDINFVIDFFSADSESVLQEQWDVAFWFGSVEDDRYIARLITELEVGLYASFDYLTIHGKPLMPEELIRHECIDVKSSTSWALTRDADKVDVSVKGRFALSSSKSRELLAIEGFGIARLLNNGVDNFKNGLLMRVLPEWKLPSLPLFILTASRLLPAHARAFIEFFSTYSE